MTMPRAPHRLPDDLAAAIGHAVSGFGFLEEALKRALYSLTRKGLGEDATETQVQDWLQRIDDIADDSLGTLIEAFAAHIKRSKRPDQDDLVAELQRLRSSRNLLCHASWRPAQNGRWKPGFINTKGEVFAGDLAEGDITAINDRTLAAAAQVVAIMRATGIDGELAQDLPPDTTDH